jgi:hypothetical protein
VGFLFHALSRNRHFLVLAVGLTAGSLGVGGTVAGAAGWELLENLLNRKLPKDEMFFSEDVLHQGRTVIVLLSENGDFLAQGRQLMAKCSAESLDPARKKCWIGLYDGCTMMK